MLNTSESCSNSSPVLMSLRSERSPSATRSAYPRSTRTGESTSRVVTNQKVEIASSPASSPAATM